MTLPGAIAHGSRRVLLKYHRLLSGSSLHPPNSVSALRELLAGGVEVIEFDVHAIADGAYVLNHDDTFDGETTGTGAVRGATPAVVKAISLKGSREPPALLSEVTDILAAHRRPLKVQVDLKDQMPLEAGEVARLLRAIEPMRANTHLHVIVGCLGDWNLRTLRRLDSSLALGLDFALYLDVPEPEFPRLPLRVNVYGYLDDHPLGYVQTLSTRDYLVDRIESLCALVPGAVEVYLRMEFIQRALADGVNPVEIVRRRLGAVLVDGWTLNADHLRAAAMLQMLLQAGVDQITTDTAVQIAALMEK